MQSIDMLGALHALANQADEIALKFFNQASLYVSQKSDMSPVSEADLGIEMMIKREASALFPGVEVWGEEFGLQNPEAPLKLIVDPIDGTRNFVRGIPLFATLLAIQSGDEIVAGVVSAPALHERWCAAKGYGAWQNGREMRVSDGAVLAQAQVFHGSLYGNECETLPLSEMLQILSHTQRQRGLGDFYSHVLVAQGAGEFALDFGLKPWDIAPLKIIVEEAGGKLTNLDGQFSLENPNVLTSNFHLHEVVLGYFQKNSEKIG